MKKRYTLEQKKWDSPAEHAMPEHTRVPASFTIGNVRIAPATVLAPMAGVTDTVFRRFIKNASQFSPRLCHSVAKRRICSLAANVDAQPPTSSPAAASS